jgi:hypothetical protein
VISHTLHITTSGHTNQRPAAKDLQPAASDHKNSNPLMEQVNNICEWPLKNTSLLEPLTHLRKCFCSAHYYIFHVSFWYSFFTLFRKIMTNK